MDLAELLGKPFSFEWDDGNTKKNWEKHKVMPAECEDLFFNEPFIIPAMGHSEEIRYLAYGITDKGRNLFAAFTIREKKIRIISARDMSRKERKNYREKIKKNPEIYERG